MKKIGPRNRRREVQRSHKFGTRMALVAAVERVRRTGCTGAPAVHAALITETEWNDLSLSQVRRALTAANAKAPVDSVVTMRVGGLGNARNLVPARMSSMRCVSLSPMSRLVCAVPPCVSAAMASSAASLSLLRRRRHCNSPAECSLAPASRQSLLQATLGSRLNVRLMRAITSPRRGAALTSAHRLSCRALPASRACKEAAAGQAAICG